MAIINQEQAREYQEMAALACLALDMLANDSGEFEDTKEMLEYIKFVNDDIVECQTNTELRQQKFEGMLMIFNCDIEVSDVKMS